MRLRTRLCLAALAAAPLLAPPLRAQDGGPFKLIQPAGYATPLVNSTASPAVLAGETLYLSGQSGRNPDGSLPADFKTEVAQSMARVADVLKAANMDNSNLAWLTVYVTDDALIEPMNQVYWQHIGAHPPARTILRVTALPNGEHVEINAIAALGQHREIWPTRWPHAAHTDPPAIAVKDVFYLSAQSGTDPATGKPPADYAAEVKQALDNVQTILKSASMTMANVVWVNPYVAERPEAPPAAAATPIAHNGQPTANSANSMNRIYATYFEFGHTPGRGTITVAGLPQKQNIVFSVIAGADLTKRKDIQTFNMPPSPTASPGCMYRDTYYMSGKSGFIPDQGVVTQDIALQARQTMRNLQDDLQAANMTWTDNVFATIYMREIKDTDTEYSIYKLFFKTPPLPAQTTLQQSTDMKTTTGEQITLIAVRQPKP